MVDLTIVPSGTMVKRGRAPVERTGKGDRVLVLRR